MLRPRKLSGMALRLMSSKATDPPTSINVHEHKITRPALAKPKVHIVDFNEGF